MYKNGKILIGKNEDTEVNILLNMANRHGLITGATGTGKTITVNDLAESFSSAGVPVFMIDVKGDLAGTSMIGEANENITSRVQKMELDGFDYKKYPVTFLDVYGKNGHPVRTTVQSVGHRLMSKMLGLTDVQDSVLSMIYKIAEDENKEMDTLEDLQSMLIYVNNNRNEYSLKYGNLPTQSITTIQRNVLELIEDVDGKFFGYPKFDIKDLRGFDVDNGYGKVSILDAQELFRHPDSYAVMILWLLNELYNTMPEVGDVEKPKMVFFIDEAHLLFDDMPKAIVDHIIQIVKLIRSKGIGLYFVSQLPGDIPEEILAQLGNRVQHALHAYTPQEQRSLKLAADSFRVNPKFDTAKEIQNLGTGEALVSVLDEKGNPTITESVKILPPQSRMGTISDEERRNIILNSDIYGKYEESEDRESAKEKNDVILEAQAQAKQDAEDAKAAEKQAKIDEKLAKEEERRLKAEQREKERQEKEAEKAKKNSIGYKLGKKVVTKTENKIIDKTLNKLLKGFFK
jgi:DNA helicase HerA-like ATPase